MTRRPGNEATAISRSSLGMRPAPPTYIDNFYLFVCEGLSAIACWKVEYLVALVLLRVLYYLCDWLGTQLINTENNQCWTCVCVWCIGRRRRSGHWWFYSRT